MTDREWVCVGGCARVCVPASTVGSRSSALHPSCRLIAIPMIRFRFYETQIQVFVARKKKVTIFHLTPKWGRDGWTDGQTHTHLGVIRASNGSTAAAAHSESRTLQTLFFFLSLPLLAPPSRPTKLRLQPGPGGQSAAPHIWISHNPLLYHICWLC